KLPSTVQSVRNIERAHFALGSTVACRFDDCPPPPPVFVLPFFLGVEEDLGFEKVLGALKLRAFSSTLTNIDSLVLSSFILTEASATDPNTCSPRKLATANVLKIKIRTSVFMKGPPRLALLSPSN